MKSTAEKRLWLEDLLTDSPLSTNVCSWEYVSKMDICGHQVWMVLSKPITGEIQYKFPLNDICVLFLTGCRFLFSRWFCSMIFKSCSPSSILSVKEKKMFVSIKSLCSIRWVTSSQDCRNHWPVVFMSCVERLGKTLSETVGVGEEGDCGGGVHNDTSKSTSIVTKEDHLLIWLVL